MAATKTKAADDLTTEKGIRRRLLATRSLAEWNEACREVRDANGPGATWYRAVVTSGALLEQARANWEGGS